MFIKKILKVIFIAILLQSCASRQMYNQNEDEIRKLMEELMLYKIPVEYISSSDANDETKVSTNGRKCDIEQLVRDNFVEHQVYFNKDEDDEIWFYRFSRRIDENIISGDSYLLEIFIINYSDESQIHCQVKYFDSLNKMIGKIKSTTEKGSGLNELRNLIINCYG